MRNFNALVLWTGLFLVLVMGTDAMSAEKTSSACMVVAHRGFSSLAPENTLAALSKAIEIGAGGSEFDVYASCDGKLVVMHDGKVDRTTDGKGDITKMSLAELKKLDAGSWKGSQFKGERIPTLEEMLTKLKGTQCKPVIEIKERGIAEKVVADVRNADMVDQAVVISFHADAVKQVRALEPRIPCAWLCGEFPKQLPAEKHAEWLVSQAKACDTDFVDLSYKMLSADLVAQLQKQGLTVWAWTVDEPKDMDDVMGWGVASITTNRPDVLLERVQATK
jgi:glycerophosphoryl diester phosphodiesterase